MIPDPFNAPGALPMLLAIMTEPMRELFDAVRLTYETSGAPLPYSEQVRLACRMIEGRPE